MSKRGEFILDGTEVTSVVDKAEDYLYSSARNYSGMKDLIDVEFLWKARK